jgi:hypothetical protein
LRSRLQSKGARPMSGASKISKQIDFRRRVASADAELIARSRDAVARSRMILEEDLSSMFIGAKQGVLRGLGTSSQPRPLRGRAPLTEGEPVRPCPNPPGPK